MAIPIFDPKENVLDLNGATLKDTQRDDTVIVADLRIVNTIYDDLIVAITPKAGVSPKLIDFNSGDLQVYGFGEGVKVEKLFFTIKLPHRYKVGTDIFPHIHWSPVDNSGGDVLWELEYQYGKIGDVFSNSITTSVVQAAGDTAWKHNLAFFDVIDGSDLHVNTIIVGRITRRSQAIEDTYLGDAAFLQFDFHIEVDGVGSGDLLEK
jgi:hypothetical protein